MMRNMLKSKIHRARVNGANLDYEGSVTIDEDLKIITMKSSDPTGTPIIFAYEWNDDNTMTLTTQTEFDFTLQGNPPVPAIVTIIIKRST